MGARCRARLFADDIIQILLFYSDLSRLEAASDSSDESDADSEEEVDDHGYGQYAAEPVPAARAARAPAHTSERALRILDLVVRLVASPTSALEEIRALPEGSTLLQRPRMWLEADDPLMLLVLIKLLEPVRHSSLIDAPACLPLFVDSHASAHPMS